MAIGILGVGVVGGGLWRWWTERGLFSYNPTPKTEDGRKELARFVRQGQTILAALDKYKHKHGAFPASEQLEKLGPNYAPVPGQGRRWSY